MMVALEGRRLVRGKGKAHLPEREVQAKLNGPSFPPVIADAG
jgi:hypothetical protein